MGKTLPEETITYQVFGSGKRVIISFHGFGQSPEVYKELSRRFQEITLYSFSLPVLAKDGGLKCYNSYTQKQFVIFFKHFLKAKKITLFDVVGFSIGARAVFFLLNHFHTNIGIVYLLAPDGVYEHWVYSLATRYKLGRLLFYKLTKEWYRPFAKILQLLYKYMLLDRKKYTLINKQLGKEENRKLLFSTWLGCSFFTYPLKDLQKRVVDKQLIVILAQYDWLIDNEKVKTLLCNFPNTQFTTLQATHENLIKKWVASEPTHFKKNDCR